MFLEKLSNCNYFIIPNTIVSFADIKKNFLTGGLIFSAKVNHNENVKNPNFHSVHEIYTKNKMKFCALLVRRLR